MCCAETITNIFGFYISLLAKRGRDPQTVLKLASSFPFNFSIRTSQVKALNISKLALLRLFRDNQFVAPPKPRVR